MVKKSERKPNKGKKPTSRNDDAALSYLWTWYKDRASWKFNKVKQAYLLEKLYDDKLVPKAYFKILRKYMKGLQGAARDRAIQDATKVITQPQEPEAPASAAPTDSSPATGAGAAVAETSPAPAPAAPAAPAPADDKLTPTDELKIKRARRVLRTLGAPIPPRPTASGEDAAAPTATDAPKKEDEDDEE
ncbi:hypothetical protein PAPYR_8947 [Paratrimastix pyriformis]|uniref:WKF domain-containing protein n=1 Tax=Paratrimastix pyriformis TaxID=342808 RepID=A0ABQ8U9K5_9EUKA|nr:hypothetical protein PAPYR_8947 [Paratrimastix pyriformis]